MKVGIIDADLIGRKRHRFPNLVCMKLSGYHKDKGDNVKLKTDYDGLEKYDKVYIAKVFTDTAIPEGGMFGSVLEKPNVEYGGTGFYYDKAKPLPEEIEHAMPDYQLYDEWLSSVDKGGKEFKAYKEYSIGYLTRGCFRHCQFCVNRQSSKVKKNSPLEEFLNPARKKISLLDDNFLGYEKWRYELKQLIDTGKPFQFKQGLDIRLLDEEKAELLFKARYDGDYIFAFDDYRDSPVIESKLKLISKHYELRWQRVKFYVLCGYDRYGKYDERFWAKDLKELVLRLALVKKYQSLSYVMRYEKYTQSPYRKVYADIAAYANQPQFYQKMKLMDFIDLRTKGRFDKSLVEELQKLMEEA